MFGPRITTVFKSRWNALFWAAGVLTTAYCTVPAAEDVAKQESAQVAAAKSEHKNPWSKDSAN
ncbi:hypothetical protein SAMN05518801_103165 [Novosphingobium sp. CF614]|uniref:hypothetical protein n=1 Tax=Novosphingobium sp. CF614 TaxID=1884364 RepID=UPI0008F337BF|nr:hypothetical protein [Novosphingobium sp. CF614]SFF91761.1 hypothetical protein SAMN05518801_103165 [Novosphingobium sp. CF614]